MPLETLWPNGNHTHGVKNSVARLAGKFKCKGQSAKKARGEPKTCWEISIPQRISEKKRPSSPFSLETVESSLSDSPKKQEMLPLFCGPLLPYQFVYWQTRHSSEEQDAVLFCGTKQSSGRMTPLAIREINRLSSNLWGLFLSTQTGGGIKGSQLFSFYNSRAPVLEQRAQ